MLGSDAQVWIQFKSVTHPIRRNATTSIGRSINSDLNSRNGKKVNGRPVSGPTQLYHRDVIKVGEPELLILFEQDQGQPGTESGVPLL